MWIATAIFFVGLGLSAFFSGSETGFYRITRVRLLIDALGGDWISKGLLWATNNPAAFVATALVGNNVANYLTSLSVVMACEHWFPGAELAEMLMPIVLAPIVFVYGELLPKNVFFEAPNRLLRKCGPALLIAGVVFAPISIVLWGIARLLAWVGRSPKQTIQLVLARRELSEVFAEGHAAGILAPAQRRLAQATFASANRPIRQFMTPATRQVRATTNMTRKDALRLARRQRLPVLPVEDPAQKRQLVGYVRAIDCALDPEGGGLPLRPLMEADEGESFLAVLTRMQTTGEPIASIRDASGRLVGFVRIDHVQQALLAET